MDETPEQIRQQMEETKCQLTEKLSTLEQQVSDTVQATGSVVNATVEAVTGTVESVTGAVETAVHSVGEAFDLRKQLDRNPWLVLGGAAFLGYVVADCLTSSKKRPVPTPAVFPVPMAAIPAAAAPTEAAAAMTAAYEAHKESNAVSQLKGIAIGTLIGILQGVATRAVPQVLDYIAEHHMPPRPQPAELTEENMLADAAYD